MTALMLQQEPTYPAGVTVHGALGIDVRQLTRCRNRSGNHAQFTADDGPARVRNSFVALLTTTSSANFPQ